ncbi:MAG: hypothetical protein ACRC33_00680 [Gemmataceae bacterium]
MARMRSDEDDAQPQSPKEYRKEIGQLMMGLALASAGLFMSIMMGLLRLSSDRQEGAFILAVMAFGTYVLSSIVGAYYAYRFGKKRWGENVGVVLAVSAFIPLVGMFVVGSLSIQAKSILESTKKKK